MRDFDTLSEAMNVLRSEGYTEDFNLKIDRLTCRDDTLDVMPKDFEIDEYFRFEGMSSAGDASILYAISSKKHNLKGQLVNGYGIYTEETTDELLEKLKTHHG